MQPPADVSNGFKLIIEKCECYQPMLIQEDSATTKEPEVSLCVERFPLSDIKCAAGKELTI